MYTKYHLKQEKMKLKKFLSSKKSVKKQNMWERGREGQRGALVSVVMDLVITLARGIVIGAIKISAKDGSITKRLRILLRKLPIKVLKML